MKKMLLLVLTTILGMTAADSVTAQIADYQDSARFDDDFGRLRDIDFEDIYGATVDRMTIRNPYGLQSLTIPDSLGEPTTNIMLELSQGATVAFPTRTRSVLLEGYSNPFYVHITTFQDSTYTVDLTTFPTILHDDAGIARIQFFGTDGFGLDINWHAGLFSIAALDDAGDTVAFSNFDELEGDRYYFMGRGMNVSWIGDTSFIEPVEVHGITVNEPNIGFVGIHLSEFEGRPDADNPIGNLGVLFYADATIDFPTGTQGALLVLEQVHPEDTVLFEAIDYDDMRDTVMVVGWGREYDTNWVEQQRATYAHVAFSSSAGIKQIRLLSAWTTAPVDVIDTLIDGEWVEQIIYDQVGIETYLMSVHVAEAPPTEIGGINAQVEEIDNAGYLAGNEVAQLNTQLLDAQMFAQTGDDEKAIQRLKDFKSEVAALYQTKALVIEESRRFQNDADYVISRLQAGTLGVSASTIEPAAMPRIEQVRLTASGMQFHYRLPEVGSQIGEIVVSDITGRLVRRIPLQNGASEGEALWNLKDGEGRDVPTGTYILSLGSGRVTATAKVAIVR